MSEGKKVPSSERISSHSASWFDINASYRAVGVIQKLSTWTR